MSTDDSQPTGALPAATGTVPESGRCDEGSCSAIVEGAAYSVLVHEDDDGDRTFGVATYSGN